MAPAPCLSCDPDITVDGSGVPSDPDCIDEQFRKAWLPFLCWADRGAVDLSAFDKEVGGWIPSLDEIDFPPHWGLTFIMLYNISGLRQVDRWVEWLEVAGP